MEHYLWPATTRRTWRKRVNLPLQCTATGNINQLSYLSMLVSTYYSNRIFWIIITVRHGIRVNVHLPFKTWHHSATYLSQANFITTDTSSATCAYPYFSLALEETHGLVVCYIVTGIIEQCWVSHAQDVIHCWCLDGKIQYYLYSQPRVCLRPRASSYTRFEYYPPDYCALRIIVIISR